MNIDSEIRANILANAFDRTTLLSLLQALFEDKHNQSLAIICVDDVLQLYEQGQFVFHKADLLKRLLDIFPDNFVLRQHLITLYIEVGWIADAIDHLDILGEQQLAAGLNREAAGTIRRLMDLQEKSFFF